MEKETQIDWNAVAERARGMSVAALEYSIRDCRSAAAAAWELQRRGVRVSKTQGYYHDEAWVYQDELNRRRNGES